MSEKINMHLSLYAVRIFSYRVWQVVNISIVSLMYLLESSSCCLILPLSFNVRTLLFFSEVIITADARWLVDQNGMRGVHGLHFSLTKSLTRNWISELTRQAKILQMRYSSNIYNSKSQIKTMFQLTQFVMFCYSADVERYDTEVGKKCKRLLSNFSRNWQWHLHISVWTPHKVGMQRRREKEQVLFIMWKLRSCLI